MMATPPSEASTLRGVADVLAGLGAVRSARKPYRCRCAERNGIWVETNPDYRPDCLHEIAPGDTYFEYTGETPAYQSGVRYCVRCAVAVWLPVAIREHEERTRPGTRSLGELMP
jgi:hypothetical protein